MSETSLETLVLKQLEQAANGYGNWIFKVEEIDKSDEPIYYGEASIRDRYLEFDGYIRFRIIASVARRHVVEIELSEDSWYLLNQESLLLWLVGKLMSNFVGHRHKIL